jgi:hypothetical protein
MSSTIHSSGPSNSMQSFDVQKVLETLRTPLEALKTLVDKTTVEASRERIKAISNRPESSQAEIVINPYHDKTLQTILSENSSNPVGQENFLATVEQIKDTCRNNGIDDIHSLFDQLSKLHLTGTNSTDKQPYARLTEEIRLGIIATGAKKVLERLATQGETAQCDNLIRVLKSVAQGVPLGASAKVNYSLVRQFKLEPGYEGDSFHHGRAADPLLVQRLGDRELARLNQHNVEIYLKSAQAWRADLNKEQSVNNTPLTKEKLNFRETINNLSNFKFFD